MKSVKELLEEKIDETLERVSTDQEPSVSDLFNVLRWSKLGLLQRKVG